MQETFCFSVKSGCWVLVKIWLELAKQAERARPHHVSRLQKRWIHYPQKFVLDNQGWKRSTSNWIWRYVFSYSTHIYIYTHTEFESFFGAYKKYNWWVFCCICQWHSQNCCFLWRSKPPHRGFLRFYILEKGNVTIVRDGKVWGLVGLQYDPKPGFMKGADPSFLFEVCEIGFTTYTIWTYVFSTSFLNALRITTILYWLAISLFIYPLYKSGGSAGDQTTIYCWRTYIPISDNVC